MNRRIAIELLTKMGVEVNKKQSLDRISRRLARVCKQNGIPENATKEEKELAEELLAKPPAPAAKDEGAETKKRPSAAAPKKAKANGDGGKGRGGKASDLFRKIFSTDKPVRRADVVDRLVKEGGVNPATAVSYIAWAKRPIKNKIKNPFGIRIVATKDDKGTKWLKPA